MFSSFFLSIVPLKKLFSPQVIVACKISMVFFSSKKIHRLPKRCISVNVDKIKHFNKTNRFSSVYYCFQDGYAYNEFRGLLLRNCEISKVFFFFFFCPIYRPQPQTSWHSFPSTPQKEMSKSTARKYWIWIGLLNFGF